MADPPGHRATSSRPDPAARQHAALATPAILRVPLPPLADQAVLFLRHQTRRMPFIPKLGELKPDRDIPEWRVSEPVPVPFFAGTVLPFIVEDEAELDAPDVHAAVDRALSLGEADRLAASTPAFENYHAFLVASDLEPLDIGTPTEVWQYVKPTAVHVIRRRRRDRDVYVTFMCECAWEEEHGLQLVFRGGDRLVRVSDQDGDLTHADAYDLPDDQDVGLRATSSSSGGSSNGSRGR